MPTTLKILNIRRIAAFKQRWVTCLTGLASNVTSYKYFNGYISKSNQPRSQSLWNVIPICKSIWKIVI